MATKKRKFGVRLSAEGAKEFEQDMKKAGLSGKYAMDRVEEASRPATRGLKLFNRAGGEAKQGMEGLAQRAGGVAKIARVLGPAGLVLGGAIGALVGLGGAAKAAAGDLADIGDAADRAQIDVDVYEQLKAALTLEGQNANSLEAALASVVRKAGEARAGIGEAAKTFDRLGASLTNADGSGKTDAELIREISDAFARLPDGATRAAFSQKLFEEGGKSLAIVLAKGGDELQRTFDKAQQLGLLYGGDLIRSAQEVNATFGVQSQVIGVQLKTALVQLAPKVSELTGRFVENLPAIILFIEKAAEAIGLIEEGVGSKIDRRARIAERLAELDKRMGGPDATQRQAETKRLRAELAELNNDITDLEAKDAARLARVKQITDELANRKPISLGGADAANKEADAFDRIVRSAQARRDALVDEVFSAGAQGEQLFFLQEQARLTAALTQSEVALTDERIAKRNELARSFAEQSVALDQMKQAQALLAAVEEDGLSTAERMQRARAQMAALLPSLTTLTGDQAEAERILAAAMEKSDKDLQKKGATQSQVLTGLRSDLSGLRKGTKDAGDVINSFVDRSIDMLFKFATDPVFDLLQKQFSTIGSGASGGAAGGGLGGFFQAGVSALSAAFFTSAKGNVFGGGDLVPFAAGGVLDRPTRFSFGGGRRGLAAEAGDPEGLLPLKRMADGVLGVRAEMGGGGGAVTIVNNVSVSVEGGQGADEQVGDEVAEAIIESLVRTEVTREIVEKSRPGGFLDMRFQRRDG